MYIDFLGAMKILVIWLLNYRPNSWRMWVVLGESEKMGLICVLLHVFY
uniref:7TM_GPCR_Srx domain-containing protein n=1 Tax=Heterorhabditis bacteriophora TaxID=37862 RepID=A0A1I7WQQ3_HETBA